MEQAAVHGKSGGLTRRLSGAAQKAAQPAHFHDIRHIEIGGNIASDSGIYTFTYNTTGMKIKARYSFTYRWNGTQWLIASHHSSFMPES